MREEIIGDARLILGDCREVLPTLERVDACVTDPPYGIGENSKQAVTRGMKPSAKWKNPKAKDYGFNDWDKVTHPDVIELCRQISSYQIIFGGNYYPLPPAKCWLVWDKKNGDTDFADCELAWTNLNKAVRKIEWLWSGFKKQVPEERFHITQKPLGVMKWCLDQLPDNCVTILDPFAGSGTTGVAAVQHGKTFIGIEREPSYFEVMCRRIEATSKSPNLFIAPPEPKPIQGELIP